jgi:hypothetical protein
MKEKPKERDRTKERLTLGEAWMWCNECGAKLYSFDGHDDKDKRCPYKKDSKGRCSEELK